MCAAYADDGMVDVRSSRCGHSGCSKRPSYGKAGERTELRTEHAKDSMVDTIHKRCGHTGCTTQSSFGDPVSRKRETCAEHSKEGMIKPCANGRSEQSSAGVDCARVGSRAGRSTVPPVGACEKRGRNPALNGLIAAVSGGGGTSVRKRARTMVERKLVPPSRADAERGNSFQGAAGGLRNSKANDATTIKTELAVSWSAERVEATGAPTRRYCTEFRT